MNKNTLIYIKAILVGIIAILVTSHIPSTLLAGLVLIFFGVIIVGITGVPENNE